MLLNEKLDKMIGNSYLYQGRRHKILRTRTNGDTVEIATDRDWLAFPKENAHKALSEFLPAAEERAVTISALAGNGKMEKIAATVFDNIDKLKSDPAYIDQARAINDSIKTMVEVAKLELEIVKMRAKME